MNQLTEISHELNHNNIPIFSDVCSEAEVLYEPVIAIIVALGSNTCPVVNLRHARDALNHHFGQVVWSTEYVNPDYTATFATPKPDYTNQCGYVLLPNNQEYFIKDLIQICKTIELGIETIDCPSVQQQHSTQIQSKRSHQDKDDLNRHGKKIKNNKRQVLIDIDILAVKTSRGLIALKKRYPFKQHEVTGMVELHKNNAFSEFGGSYE